MSKTSPRIERAADLLDQAAPGWDRGINLDHLDLSHGRYCVLGQVYGDYHTGLRTLDGDAEKRPGRYGFMTWGAETFPELTRKWRAFLTSRRETRRAA